MEETKKKCPYCGEEILAVAKKCKYCGEWLGQEKMPEEKKMVECPVCAEEIEEGVKVCPYCHETLPSATTEPERGSGQTIESREITDGRNRQGHPDTNNMKNYVIWAVIAAVVIGVSCIVWISGDRSSISDASDDDNSIMSILGSDNSNPHLKALKAEGRYEIIAMNKTTNIVYCLDKTKEYIASYIKYDLETGAVMEKDLSSEEIAGIQCLEEAFYVKEENSIVFIGSTGGIGMFSGASALRLDLATDQLNEICFGRGIRRDGKHLLVEQMEMLSAGDCAANNEYFFYEECYDFKGKKIDGKSVHGMGTIGKYQVEMSIHALSGKLTGWYKYKGHSGYLTLEGKIDENGHVELVEMNDRKETTARLTGQASFESKVIYGIWKNKNNQLDFYIKESTSDDTGMLRTTTSERMVEENLKRDDIEKRIIQEVSEMEIMNTDEEIETEIMDLVPVQEEDEPKEEDSDPTIYTVVEKQPEFPGGQAALMQYLSKNIKYPKIAAENGVQGRVIVQFVVNKDGSIVDAVVTRGIDPYLDEEALRLVNAMPKWKPGEQRNKPVRARFTLPIMFRLQ